VKNRQHTISIAEKLDVISQVKKGEGIIEICCNTRFAPLAYVHADRIREVAKSGTKALDFVA